MKADREMPVKVMLNYGSFIPGIILGGVRTTYRKYPVHFSAFDHKVKGCYFFDLSARRTIMDRYGFFDAG